MRVLLLLVLLAAGCASHGGAAPGSPPGGGPAPARVEPHETFVRNPTLVEGDEVQAILPAAYREDLDLTGLSGGWEPGAGVSTWNGSGVCTLELHELGIRARRSLTVTLVDAQTSPEVMIQASGNVGMRHSVRGIGSSVRDAKFLLLRNDKSVEH